MTKRVTKKPPKKFWGVQVSTWYGIAKWLSIAGASIAALVTAVASAYKMIWR